MQQLQGQGELEYSIPFSTLSQTSTGFKITSRLATYLMLYRKSLGDNKETSSMYIRRLILELVKYRL